MNNQHNNNYDHQHYYHEQNIQPSYHEQNIQPINHEQKTPANQSVFPQFFSLKTHNKNAAFEIKPTITQKGFHTVNIENALAIPNTHSPIKYDWQHKKIVIQITKTELAELIMVLFGMIKTVEFKNHNVGSIAKSIKLESQEGGIYTKTNMHDKENKNNSMFCSVKIPTNEALLAGHTALVQYCQNFPTLTTDSALKTFEYTIKSQINFKKKR